MSEYRLETEEDMSSYLDASFGHGRTATFTNTSGQTSTIELILNNEYFEEEFGVGVEGTQPIAFCRTVDVPTVKHGNTLVAAQTYKVVNVQKDNTGFTSLMLEES